MKYIFPFLFFGLITFSSCSNQSAQSTSAEVQAEEEEPDPAGTYGEPLSDIPVTTYSELLEIMKESQVAQVKLQGQIEKACKKKGCWMRVNVDEGAEMMVTFKDYGFFVPMNSDGHRFTMEGLVFWDSTSVEMLRHYAEDEGLSEEEINAITEPKKHLAIEATGVVIE